MAASYALWLAAAILRKPYLASLVVFAAWDGYHLARAGGMRGLISTLRPQPRADWPILVPVALAIWFSAMQWPHPGNSAYTGLTTKWFPIKDPKSLAATYFFQGFNWKYIEHQYGSFEGKDFYFTNQEVFKGETEVWPAILANPQFVFEQVCRNISDGTGWLISQSTFLPAHGLLVSILLAGALLYGVVQATSDRSLSLLAFSHLPIVATVILVVPEIGRHYLPVMPIVLLGAIGWANIIRRLAERQSFAQLFFGGCFCFLAFTAVYILSRLISNTLGPKTLAIVPLVGIAAVVLFLLSKKIGAFLERRLPRIGHWLARASLPVMLLVCSTGASRWPAIIHGIVSDIGTGKWHILENRHASMKASYEEWQRLMIGCKGIMSDNNTFIYAFMDVPLDSILDIWEIPPFGHLGDGSYDGLRPDRVDCLVIANYLKSSTGFATNYQIRYQNYLEPYAEELQRLGAETHEIGTFGSAFVLRR